MGSVFGSRFENVTEISGYEAPVLTSYCEWLSGWGWGGGGSVAFMDDMDMTETVACV